MAGWRYQPVIVSDEHGQRISLCEVYFDGMSGELDTWTDSPSIHAEGETIEELTSDLSRMIMDAFKWVPVPFESLHVGMKFQRAIDQETAEKLADDIDSYAALAKSRVRQ